MEVRESGVLKSQPWDLCWRAPRLPPFGSLVSQGQACGLSPGQQLLFPQTELLEMPPSCLLQAVAALRRGGVRGVDKRSEVSNWLRFVKKKKKEGAEGSVRSSSGRLGSGNLRNL